MKKLLLIIACATLYSCGPKRLGCGPRRCEVKISNDNLQKNPETNVSGFLVYTK